MSRRGKNVQQQTNLKKKVNTSKKMMITSKVTNVTKQGIIDQQIPINIICIYMCMYIAFFSYQKMILTG